MLWTGIVLIDRRRTNLLNQILGSNRSGVMSTPDFISPSLCSIPEFSECRDPQDDRSVTDSACATLASVVISVSAFLVAVIGL